MRQIFSSARLETVEGVAELLNQNGIQTRITNGRSYKGNRRSRFSYTEQNRETRSNPTVWVVFPDDQPKARTLLREAGLLETTRTPYVSGPERFSSRTSTPTSTASRARVWLLVAVVILGGITVMRSCHQPDASQVPSVAPPTPAAPTQAVDEDRSHIVPIDTSLIRTEESTD